MSYDWCLEMSYAYDFLGMGVIQGGSLLAMWYVLISGLFYCMTHSIKLHNIKAEGLHPCFVSNKAINMFCFQ